MPSGWLLEVVRLALSSLAGHKLRGALTVLGIVIGITSVVGMVSIVQGLNRALENQLNALGSDTVQIDRWDAGIFVGEIPDSLLKRRHLEDADAEGIREACPSVLAVSVNNVTRQTLRYGGGESVPTRVEGIDEHYLTVHPIEIADGRALTDLEIRSGARMALLGSGVVEELFPGIDPVGEEMRIGNQTFTVGGVLSERGSILGQSLDDYVLVPRRANQRYFGARREFVELYARPVRPELLDRMIEEMTESLRRTRGLRPRDPNDFAIVTQAGLLSLWEQVTGGFFVVIVAIASVALLVGGVGVMNIMLVSVTERTREIGVRKAIGATRRQILIQFLAEAMVLTGVGGVIGILLGAAIGKLVELVSPLPSFVPVWTYIVAFSVSVGVGLFFGIWPAARAARLDPVEALRYE
jgi:putative ABC transport system permease protein